MGLFHTGGHILAFCLIAWIVNVSSKDIKFFEEPKAAEVYEGSNTVLKCIFSEPVTQCFWKKNEVTLTIGGRYEYTKGNGRNMNDCSIKISNCNSKNDNAMWKCIGGEATVSTPVQLTVHSKEAAFIHQPCDVSLNWKDNGRLDCVLRLPVTKCYWERNGMDVWIDKRYEYLFGNGRNTTSCTFLITDARPIDNGTWQCAIVEDGDAKNPIVSSRLATVNVVPVSFISEPRNVIVKSGEHIVLDCVLSYARSECFWKRNGMTIPIRGRYRYLTGNGTHTAICSIFINGVQSTDNGTWQCAYNGTETFPGLVSEEARLEITTDKSSKLVFDDSASDGNYLVAIIAACIGCLATLWFQYIYYRWIQKIIRGDVKIVSYEGEKSPLLSNEFNFPYEKQPDVSLIRNPDVYRVTSCGKLPRQTFFWIIDNFYSKTRQAFEGRDNFVCDDCYVICSQGCRMQSRIHINTLLHSCIYLDKRSISLQFKFMPDAEGNVSAHCFDHEISFILRDLKTGDMAISQTKQPVFGKYRQNQWKTDWTGNRMFATLALIEDDANYLDRDSLKVEITIRDLIPLWDDAACKDGILNWEINDFSLKRKQEEDGYFDKLTSPHFYTSPRGYLMRASLYLNGSLKHGTHIEIKLRTYRGKYDSKLPRAFPHVRNVMILPASDACNSIVQTTTIDPSVIGEDEAEFEMGKSKKALLVLRSDVENNIYLRNDTLNIKIEITPINSTKRLSETSLEFDDSNTVKYRNSVSRKVK